MKNKKIVLGAAGVAAILVAGVIGCQDRHTETGDDHKAAEYVSDEQNGKTSDKVPEETDEEEFKALTSTEWSELIGKYHDQDPKNIDCHYMESEFIGIVYDERDEEIAYYRFDEDTGYALDMNSGVVVDFLKGETVEVDMTQDNNFTFSDNQILAIGYVNDFNEEEFICQNFVSRDKYDMLSVYYFRAEENREEETGNKFVFFPKTTDVKLTFYRCHADENGELKLDDCLLSNTIGNFMVIDDYLAESTTPEVAVKLCYQGYEDIIPISFSGMDGTLALTGHEEEVRDVTVY